VARLRRRDGVDVYRSEPGREAIRRWCAERLAASAVPLEQQVVATRAGETHVVRAGAAGPLVLLVPGTNLTAVHWLEVVERLASSHRVVAVDLPGQPGLGAGLRVPRAHAAYVVALDAVLAHVGESADVTVGHSLGARVALAASVRGVPVGRLVLVNPAGLSRARIRPRDVVVSARWLVRPDAGAGALVERMAAPGVSLHPDVAQWMALVGAHARTTFAPPRLAARRRRAVPVPVTVLAGAHDPFFPPGPVERGARPLADVRVEVVDGGHLLPLERPALVAAAVARR
jgi:pimeloyl-ACP methyl ester carboxylesterase